jgi:hypothetical protein
VRVRTIISASLLVAGSGALHEPTRAQSGVKKYEAQEIQRREQLRRQKASYERAELERREQARRQQEAQEASKKAAAEAEAQRMREQNAYIKEKYGDIIERFRTFSNQLIVKCSETSIQLYLGNSSYTGKLYQVNSGNQITSETSIYMKEFQQNYDPVNIANRGVVEKLSLVSFNEISGGETYTDGDYVSSFPRSNPHEIEGAMIQIEVRPKYSDNDKEFFVSLFRLELGHPAMGSGNGEPFRQMPASNYQDPSSFDVDVSDEIENFVRTGEGNLPIADQACVDPNSLRTVNKYGTPKKSKLIYGWSVKEFAEDDYVKPYPPLYKTSDINRKPTLRNELQVSHHMSQTPGLKIFNLAVNELGDVLSCERINKSYTEDDVGISEKNRDRWSCDGIKNKAKFVPATDSMGRPVASSYTLTVRVKSAD